MMPARETERMMKLQDVILKAMARKVTWIEAAEIAGMSVRNMRRMRERYREHGYNGLFDQRRGKRSIHRVPMETAERVLGLYRDTYYDLNVRHFHEKLRDEHHIRLSYSWVKQALQGAGLVAKRRKRGPHRRRRPRRPLPGMPLHIDGSKEPKFSVSSALRIEHLDTCEIGVQNRHRRIEDFVVQRLDSGGVDQLRCDAMKMLGDVKFGREHLLTLSQRRVDGFRRQSLLFQF